MLDDFFVRAMVAGVGVALLAGPLGCFIVWRRMAFFGGTMAHSALLGVALGLIVDVNPILGVTAVTVAVALLLVALQGRDWLASDTLLGILAHASLALGLVVIGAMTWLRVDLLGFLFGDVLAVTVTDIVVIYTGGSVVLAVMAAIWRPLLALTVHEGLARAEGVPTFAVRLAFMLLIALVISLAMKIIGILLITSLLIIPAAAARRFAGTPERMAVMASVIGAVAVVLGLHGSLYLDAPAGPSIVVAATAVFALSLIPIPGLAGRAHRP
ncbi:MAG: metal ABC transporter permease [Rhodospirillales bacterium]|nr:metal ABC transporter permease [Rhodospirillales bacterium]